jgi:hypothetical protein
MRPRVDDQSLDEVRLSGYAFHLISSHNHRVLQFVDECEQCPRDAACSSSESMHRSTTTSSSKHQARKTRAMAARHASD